MPPGSQVTSVLLSKWKGRLKHRKEKAEKPRDFLRVISPPAGYGCRESGCNQAELKCSLRKCSLFLCALANSGWNGKVAMTTSFFFF